MKLAFIMEFLEGYWIIHFKVNYNIYLQGGELLDYVAKKGSIYI